MSVKDYIYGAIGVVEGIIFLLMGAGLLVFLWGLVRFIVRAGDAKGVEEGRNHIIWGLVALFVMTTVWGIIKLIGGELEIEPSGSVFPVR